MVPEVWIGLRKRRSAETSSSGRFPEFGSEELQCTHGSHLAVVDNQPMKPILVEALRSTLDTPPALELLLQLSASNFQERRGSSAFR